MDRCKHNLNVVKDFTGAFLLLDLTGVVTVHGSEACCFSIIIRLPKGYGYHCVLVDHNEVSSRGHAFVLSTSMGQKRLRKVMGQ